VDASRRAHVAALELHIRSPMSIFRATCSFQIRPVVIRSHSISSQLRSKICTHRVTHIAPRCFTSLPPLRTPTPPPNRKPTIRENIYTIPNLLTLSRILACPALGWSIIDGNFTLATSLLIYAGVTDGVSFLQTSVVKP
jgi:cardiolipin synthase